MKERTALVDKDQMGAGVKRALLLETAPACPRRVRPLSFGCRRLEVVGTLGNKRIGAIAETTTNRRYP
jgi:hypothetical protein